MSSVAIPRIVAIAIFMFSVCANGNAAETPKECTPDAKTLHIGMTAWELEHCWPPFRQCKKLSERQLPRGGTFTSYLTSETEAAASGVRTIFVEDGRVTLLLSTETTRKCRPDARTLHIGMTAWELEHCWPPFNRYVKISEKQGAQGTVTVYETRKAQAPADGVNKIFVVDGRVFIWGKVQEPNPNAEHDFQRRLRQRYFQ